MTWTRLKIRMTWRIRVTWRTSIHVPGPGSKFACPGVFAWPGGPAFHMTRARFKVSHGPVYSHDPEARIT